MFETYLAPAKINLGLEVLYKRPDNYHELNTLFYRVPEPHDIITVTSAGFFRLTCSDESLPTDNRNLMVRAAEEFIRLVCEPLPRLHIHLEKRIPMGAGLGGGSSDAAAMLLILQHWYAHSTPSKHPIVPEEELSKIAAKLGADVPFFLSGANIAQASGIGEKLHPMQAKLQASVLIVVDPAIHISTKEAYAALHPSQDFHATDYRKLFEARIPLTKWKEQLGNDFEPEIFRRFPHLAEMKHALYANGASFALMSGSGSALYGLFENPDAAREAKVLFEDQGNLALLSEPESI